MYGAIVGRDELHVIFDLRFMNTESIRLPMRSFHIIVYDSSGHIHQQIQLNANNLQDQVNSIFCVSNYKYFSIVTI